MNGTFIVNKVACNFSFNPTARLLTVLRDNGFTEVKQGCQEGLCGACLVIIDQQLVNSCQVLAASCLQKQITTVKGIGTLHHPHIIQEAFVEAGAVQCGFCTPGMVLATYNLLNQIPQPSEEQIKQFLDGNLCRCTGYVKIINAVKIAARRLNQGNHGKN
ncbi:MAG: ferredoxin [Desulfuromonas sp. SDB]|nr:MAG: ferredoxin [Desulfuromonas sp. SDB]